MRLTLAVASLVILLVILIKSGVIDALLMFILIGAIPSTSLVLSPSVMITIVIAIGWVALINISVGMLRDHSTNLK